MEKTELFPYQRITQTKSVKSNNKEKRIFSRRAIVQIILVNLVGFMLGRVVVLSGLAPFGLPFYAACFSGVLEVNIMLIGLCTIAGVLTAGVGILSFKYIVALILFTATAMLLKNFVMKKTLFVALTVFNSLFVSGMILALIRGVLLYDVLMLLFEALIGFVMVYIFNAAIPVIKQNTERKVLSNEETISLSILFGLIILGLTDLHFPGGISLRSTLCIFILLVFSLKQGVGVAASAGVTIGLINSMVSPGMYFLIGSYAFCGLIAGIFRTFGKIGVSLGFLLANTIMTIYLNGSTEVIINVFDIMIAIALLTIIPESLLDYVGSYLNKSSDKYVNRKTYSSRIKEITVDKLDNIAKAFDQLAYTFNNIAEKRTTINTNDVTVLFDEVAERICKDCSLCFCCWEKEFHNTYQVMFKVLEKLEEKGRIDPRDVPEYFGDRCIRLDDLVDSINHMFEIYKVNLLWRHKVGESRGLISQQLDGVSRIIGNLANEITVDMQFDEEMERQLIIELDKAGTPAKDVTVLQNMYEKYEVEVTCKACGGARKCIKNIAPVVSAVLGRKMVKQEGLCSMKSNDTKCMVKYIEEEKFQVSTGIARMKKDGQVECGDNYTFMQLKDGKYVLALSDGMGSGPQASRESSTTIALLEQFLDSGFDKDVAVKMINSVLVLKSAEESFATIDISVLDLYSGNVEFVKIGAASTFIKKEDRVEVIKSTSLPVGMLKNIDMELSNKTVSDDDYIIMMSDGVLDSREDAIKKETWVKDALDHITTTNPQTMADRLLQIAIENCGSRINDDMTVLVAKVWKKI